MERLRRFPGHSNPPPPPEKDIKLKKFIRWAKQNKNLMQQGNAEEIISIYKSNCVHGNFNL